VAFLEDLSLLPSTLPLVLPPALLALGDVSRVAGERSRARFGDMERALEMKLEINCFMDDFEPLKLATVFGVFGVFDSPSLPPGEAFVLVLL